MHLIRASAMHLIMTDAKSKKDDDLSVGALTYCYELAKEFVYNYRSEVSSKEMRKGILCESDAIALYNTVNFTSATKNTIRLSNEIFTGEADIVLPLKGVDTKCSWSLDTFPATIEKATAAAIKAGYDWQARVYMRLWNLPEWEIAYCMIDTPKELRRYESENQHLVSHVPEELRITVATFKRDLELEEKMIVKAKSAHVAIENFIEQITTDHC